MKQRDSNSRGLSRALVTFAVVMGLFGIKSLNLFAQVETLPPKSLSAKAAREWQWKTGEEVFQLITVEKQSKFSVQELPLASSS